ncbi:MAG: ATP-binding protein [Desulfosudis oleivorans]|nr:ATP-binding protein [Desulfosudis oleivorans]
MDLAGVNVRVRVIDNGIGIAEKHLTRIFERFYRVKDEATRYITGTGLGLPIVKGLLDAMGGIIEVQSTPGRGLGLHRAVAGCAGKNGRTKTIGDQEPDYC